MTTPLRPLLATLATGAMALAAAAPAVAYDGYGDRDSWGWHGGDSRQAIEACSRAAERQVSRNGYDRARVTDVRDVRDTRWGYEVRGRIAVNSWDRGWNRGGWNGRDWDGRGYNRGWGHGWRDDYRRHDSGSFTCRVERGRIAFLDIDGIRGF